MPHRQSILTRRLFDGDPRRDMGAIRRIRAVYRAGQRVDGELGRVLREARRGWAVASGTLLTVIRGVRSPQR